MGLLSRFFPDAWKGSAYDIDYEGLYAAGYRGILFDIDNTLVPHGMPADGQVIELFTRLHRVGFGTCLLSNNGAERVAPFAGAVDSEYIEKAHKPSPAGYLLACRRMGIRESEALFVGDQIFTDIRGARRAGIFSILVTPIHPREEIQIICKRKLERPILASFRKELRRRGVAEIPKGPFQRSGRPQIAKPIMPAEQND